MTPEGEKCIFFFKVKNFKMDGGLVGVPRRVGGDVPEVGSRRVKILFLFENKEL